MDAAQDGDYCLQANKVYMTKLKETINAYLAHPLTRGLDIDDPRVTHLRKQIIQQNPFLRQVYSEWYGQVSEALPTDVRGPVLELGSGAGFLKDLVPNLITSDITPGAQADFVIDGRHLPFQRATLRSIILVNVLHHLPETSSFFREAQRCIKSDGNILMIEPWVTVWSKFVYERLHHEPFIPRAESWIVPASGPLSSANGALPWILFERDRKEFEKQFPEWEIQSIRPIMSFKYLVSGGMSMRGLMPGWTFRLWDIAERLMSPWMNYLAMFAFIELRHRATG